MEAKDASRITNQYSDTVSLNLIFTVTEICILVLPKEKTAQNAENILSYASKHHFSRLC